MQNCWREKPLVISVSKCYFLSGASEGWVAVKSERLCVSSSDQASALLWPGPLPPLTGQLWQEAVGWVLQARFLFSSSAVALHCSGEVRARQRQAPGELFSFISSGLYWEQMIEVPGEHCPCSSLNTSLNNFVKQKKVCIFLWSYWNKIASILLLNTKHLNMSNMILKIWLLDKLPFP